MPQFNPDTITIEDCRKNLDEWLDIAASNPIFNHYDKLCQRAYDLLEPKEYDKIYKRWSSGYVLCPDGNYRRWR